VVVADASHDSEVNGLVVGLTGGMGSGKSTVSRLFADHGAAAVDADQISRQLTAADGAAMPDILRAFGKRFVLADGGLNRVAMREAAFSDQRVKITLEAILHPLIRGEIANQLTRAMNTGAPYVVLEIPLLFEAMSYRNALSRTLCVDCAVRLQIERVRLRSKLSDAEVRAIIASQIPRALRLQLADDVIENVLTPTDLIPAVASFHALYLSLAAHPDRITDRTSRKIFDANL
jgi:dephospho-CoA kinase